MQRTMPTDMKNLPNNNSLLAFTLWCNKMKKAQTQEDGLARALMQKRIAKKVISSIESCIHNDSSEMIMAESTKSAAAAADHIMSSKKTCICAPTNHAGSFRCHLHRTKNLMSCTLQQDKDNNKKERSNGRETSSVRTIGDGR